MSDSITLPVAEVYFCSEPSITVDMTTRTIKVKKGQTYILDIGLNTDNVKDEMQQQLINTTLDIQNDVFSLNLYGKYSPGMRYVSSASAVIIKTSPLGSLAPFPGVNNINFHISLTVNPSAPTGVQSLDFGVLDPDPTGETALMCNLEVIEAEGPGINWLLIALLIAGGAGAVYLLSRKKKRS